jgi:predicted RNA-binding protein (virulence factor B family)
MSEISKSASEAASKVFASMDIKWPTFADKRNVEQVLQKYIDTARQKDAEMIVRLMKQADELMTLRDSLTKQVEELKELLRESKRKIPLTDLWLRTRIDLAMLPTNHPHH